MRIRYLGYWAQLVTSSAYSAAIVFIPWDVVRGSSFSDVTNYLNRIELIGRFGLEYFDFGNSLLRFVSSEYLWAWTLAWMVENGWDPQNILNVFSAIAAFTAHAFLARYIGSLPAFIVLLNPISIDLYVSQVRSAFAFSLCLTGIWLLDFRIWRWPAYVLFAISPFFHTSMLMLVPLLLGTKRIITGTSQPTRRLAATSVAVAVAMAVLIKLTAPIILSTIEDRREFILQGGRTLAYTVFWFILPSLLIIFRNKLNMRNWRYVFVIIINYMTFFLELFGLAFFRLIGLTIPVTISVLPLVGARNRVVLVIILLLYDLLLFSYWLSG